MQEIFIVWKYNVLFISDLTRDNYLIQIFYLFNIIIVTPPQTVLKVSARVEKSVPLYRGDNEFSILTGGTFTFKTVSPI